MIKAGGIVVFGVFLLLLLVNGCHCLGRRQFHVQRVFCA